MTMILAHLVCQIWLNKAGEWVGDLNEKGLVKDQEAEYFLEKIQKHIELVDHCHGEWVLLPCAGDDHVHDSKHTSSHCNNSKRELLASPQDYSFWESLFGEPPVHSTSKVDSLKEHRKKLIDLLQSDEELDGLTALNQDASSVDDTSDSSPGCTSSSSSCFEKTKVVFGGSSFLIDEITEDV